MKKLLFILTFTAFAISGTHGQDNSVSNLIQNLLDVGFSISKPFNTGDRVSVPTGFLIPIDLTQSKGYYKYLVMVNDNSGQLKPFYIQTQRGLETSYNREIIEPLLIEYVGTVAYLQNGSKRKINPILK